MKTWILDDIAAPATAGSGGKLDLRAGDLDQPKQLPDGPSAAAWKVVRTLWPDMSDRETMRTDWGDKTPAGLAASIDSIARLPELAADNARLREILRAIVDAPLVLTLSDLKPEMDCARAALAEGEA